MPPPCLADREAARGRAIFEHLRQFVFDLTSCNVSEILAAGAASLAQGSLPLLPLQILPPSLSVRAADARLGA